MNGSTRFFVTLSAAGVALAACAAPRAPDSTSPLAAQAAAVAAEPGGYPRLADMPAAPTDVPTPDQWAVVVGGLQAARDQTLAAAAPSTFTLTDTDRYAERARAKAKAPPVIPWTGGDTEAFARAARERAKPPPSPQ